MKLTCSSGSDSSTLCYWKLYYYSFIYSELCHFLINDIILAFVVDSSISVIIYSKAVRKIVVIEWKFVFWFSIFMIKESMTVKLTGCGFDPHSWRWKIYLHLYFYFFALVSRHSAALSSASQHAISPDLGGMWGTKCLNTRFPLPTLLCAGYSVKLIDMNDRSHKFVVWTSKFRFLK